MSSIVTLRKICLALPRATEKKTWGHPTFRVAGKIFCGSDGKASAISFKVKKEDQADLVESDGRFTIAEYVGRFGWVSMDLSGKKKVDWREVEAFVNESYRLIAPKKLLA